MLPCGHEAGVWVLLESKGYQMRRCQECARLFVQTPAKEFIPVMSIFTIADLAGEDANGRCGRKRPFACMTAMAQSSWRYDMKVFCDCGEEMWPSVKGEPGEQVIDDRVEVDAVLPIVTIAVLGKTAFQISAVWYLCPECGESAAVMPGYPAKAVTYDPPEDTKESNGGR